MAQDQYVIIETKHLEFKKKKEKKHLAKTVFDKIASWPTVRNFNFDVNGNSKIATNLRALITFPLLTMIFLVAIYIFFPVFYRNTTIKTEVTME